MKSFNNIIYFLLAGSIAYGSVNAMPKSVRGIVYGRGTNISTDSGAVLSGDPLTIDGGKKTSTATDEVKQIEDKIEEIKSYYDCRLQEKVKQLEEKELKHKDELKKNEREIEEVK